MAGDEATEHEGPLDLTEEISKDEVAVEPSDTGDPAAIVEDKIPQEIRERYEIYSYRNAATILSETRKTEFGDLLKALGNFKITKTNDPYSWRKRVRYSEAPCSNAPPPWLALKSSSKAICWSS